MGPYDRMEGWSGGATVLDKLLVLGRPTIWIIDGQGPTAVGLFGHFYSHLSFLSSFSLSGRLKYCLKGPLNPKSTNQPTNGWKTRSLYRTIPEQDQQQSYEPDTSKFHLKAKIQQEQFKVKLFSTQQVWQ